MAVRPFPWASLDRIRAGDIEVLGCVRRWAGEAVLERGLAELERLVGGTVRVSLRRAQRGAGAQAMSDGVGILLSKGDDQERDPGLVLEAEGPLAAHIVARALKRPPPQVMRAEPPPPTVAGALGAVLVAAARLAGAEVPLRVRAAGSSAEILRDIRALAPELDSVTLTVLLGDEAFLARLTLPARTTTPREDRWSREGLQGLGDVWLEVPLVAASSLASASHVARLGPGDAWMPGAWALARQGADHVGSVWLAPPDREIGLRAELGAEGRLVLGARAAVDPLPWAEASTTGDSMANAPDNDPLVDAIGDVPVVVRVEVGTARMRAREWAALGPGDVIALGRRVAEPVVLRVGGVEVARGELVEIEGAVGVRILGVRTAKTPP